MFHFLPTCNIKSRESVCILKKFKRVYFNSMTVSVTLPLSIVILNLRHFKTHFFTFLGYCDMHRPFVSAFVTNGYFIGDCISAMYRKCGLEQCFMLCCKLGCRSFGHSPSQLCVINSCTVPEKSKKRKTSAGDNFQYFL